MFIRNNILKIVIVLFNKIIKKNSKFLKMILIISKLKNFFIFYKKISKKFFLGKMSSKTKKPTVQCFKCGYIFLTKDLEKHDPDRQIHTPKTTQKTNTKSVSSSTNTSFGSENLSETIFSTPGCKPLQVNSTIPFLKPRIKLCAIPYLSQEKRKEILEEIGILGWLKYHIVLIHPETLAQLEILPRSPAFLCTNANENFSKMVTIWPSTEVIHFLKLLLSRSFKFYYLYISMNLDSSTTNKSSYELIILSNSIFKSYRNANCWRMLSNIKNSDFKAIKFGRN